MNYCKKCDKVFGDYNDGEKNPNGDFVKVKNEETNWEWKTRCPYCGKIIND